MNTIFTAIFGQYDYLKPVMVPQSEVWKYICYTDQDEDSPVFDIVNAQELRHWEIRRVEKDPALSDAKNARKIKINFHDYVESEVSIWIDGTFFINTDLRLWVMDNMKADFTTVFHPFDDCVYVDGFACMSGGRGDRWELMRQLSDYRQMGLPENNGLIASGVLMRKQTPDVIESCRMWWDQVEKYSERDQVGFGYVNWQKPDCHKSIRWNYNIQKEFQHCPHRHKPWGVKEAMKIAGI